MNRMARYLFYGLILTAAVQLYQYYPQLPESMAIRFRYSGQPDSWVDKHYYLWGASALFSLIGILLEISARSLQYLDDLWINIPHKAFWLADSRRDKTIAVIQRYLYLIGDATLFFMIMINQLMIGFNLQLGENLDWRFTFLLTAYLFAVALATIKFYWAFSQKKINQITGGPVD